MGNTKLRFILASASPRRKELIGHLKLPFEIISSTIVEESAETDPVRYSSDIASLKGAEVLQRLQREECGPCFVVSADTIVCLDKKIYGKPKNRDEARIFLRELEGKIHSVFTAVSMRLLLDGKVEERLFTEESKVSFDLISETFMELYLSTGDSLDKAGAYGIQGPSLTFISKIEGDYANVVGFPLSRFIKEADQLFKTKFPGIESWLKLF
jgi:septum formation protein